MTSRKSRRGSILLARLVLAAASSALILVLLEAGSYIFGSFEGPLQPLRVGNIQIFGQHDPLLFWSLRPNAKTRDGTPWVNSDGLRGPEVGRKQRGEYRILSLGESTTFAAQMDYEQSYSAVLEHMLNAKPRNALVRVLNAGVPGYTLFQGVQYLKHRGLRFEPDMVLLYFGYNDFLPVAYLADRAGDADSSIAGLNDWELFKARHTAVRRLASFLIQHSNFFRGVLQLTHQNRAENLRSQAGRPRVPREHRQRLLEQARAFSQEHGIELVVVIPIYRSFSAHIETLRTFTATNHVCVVDLPTMLLPRFAGNRAAYFLDAVHPTPEGHHLIAQAIHEVISPRIR